MVGEDARQAELSQRRTGPRANPQALADTSYVRAISIFGKQVVYDERVIAPRDTADIVVRNGLHQGDSMMLAQYAGAWSDGARLRESSAVSDERVVENLRVGPLAIGC